MKITEMAFEGYPETDFELARDFYGKVLGHEPEKVDSAISANAPEDRKAIFLRH